MLAASCKLLRGTLQKIADNVECQMLATIDHPAILAEIEKTLTSMGYRKGRRKGK